MYFNEENQDQYVESFMGYIQILLKHSVIPLVVFDGMPLEAKYETKKSEVCKYLPWVRDREVLF